MKALKITLVCLVVGSAVVQADVKFTRLTDTQYVIHHRKLTPFGAEAKATKTAYKEAASICVAAGYSHMEIKDLNVGEREFGNRFHSGRGASADLRIKLYAEPDGQTIEDKDLVECGPLADAEKIWKARQKLEAERSQATAAAEGSR